MYKEIKKGLMIFADEMLEKYFEKPASKQYWRQQLKAEFKGTSKIWFGNLYYNGGKRVEISWDSNFIFTFQVYHLDMSIKEKLTEEFIHLLDQLSINCFLLKALDTLENVALIPFKQKAEYFNGILSDFKALSYYPLNDDKYNQTFISLKRKEEYIPIYLHGFGTTNVLNYPQQKSIYIYG
ncbi:hypothetical protein [Lysinibacillus xylanilyticus]|uniref:Uncharacterized protein n=1 Tax=Lysinibacillus xylanilyticus TaxID=582475 RepID=A0ABV3VYI0_9BACI